MRMRMREALALAASGLPARLIGVPAAGALPGLLAPGLLIILVRRPEVRAALPLPTWARLRTRAALGGAAMALNGLAALGAVVASPTGAHLAAWLDVFTPPLFYWAGLLLLAAPDGGPLAGPQGRRFER